MRLGSLLGVLFLLWTLPACQSEEPTEESQATFCQSYCDRLLECGPEFDRSSCMPFCHEYQATTPDSIEFLEAGVPCMVGSSCDDVISGNYYLNCYEEAAARTQPSAELVADCEEVVEREFECGLLPDVAQCVEVYKTLKPTVLQLVLSCTRQETCELVLACYEERFS